MTQASKISLGHSRPRHDRPRLRRRRCAFAHRRAGGPRRPRPEQARLADQFPGARVHAGYEALLADPEVDAIYIATPHPDHAEWAIKAAEAGKHVLVEKPIGLTAFEADAMFHAARRAGTFIGEAFMYRLHPQTAKLVELIAAGAIGEVRMIQSSFGFAMPAFNPDAPALRQRSRRRRHPRRRRLSGVDGAADRRRRGGPAVPRSGARSPGAAHLGAIRRRRMGRGRSAPSRTASSPRSPARSRSPRTTCCASSAPRAASRSRTSGSPAATRAAPARSTSSSATASARDRRGQGGRLALFLRGRCRRRGDPRRRARNSPRRA